MLLLSSGLPTPRGVVLGPSLQAWPRRGLLLSFGSRGWVGQLSLVGRWLIQGLATTACAILYPVVRSVCVVTGRGKQLL